MARYMKPDPPYVWRAVITCTYPDGHTSSTYAGPYANEGAAQAAKTREVKDSSRYSPIGTQVAGRVEFSSLAWEARTT